MLHFTWEGDPKGDKRLEMTVNCNGKEIVTDKYTEGWNVDIPLSGDKLELKLTLGKENGRKFTHFERVLGIKPGSNYSCLVEGSVRNTTGLGVRFCEGDEVSDDVPKMSGSKFGIGLLSVLFPVYGIYKGITDAYMRATALVCAAIGFMLGMITSMMAEEGDMISFGFGRASLFEYEPFSFTDIIINLLVGGIASIRGFLYMFLESTLG